MIHLEDPDLAQNSTLMIPIIAKGQHMILMIQREDLEEVDLKMTWTTMIHLEDPDLAQNSTLMILIIAKGQHMILMIQREGLEEADLKMT